MRSLLVFSLLVAVGCGDDDARVSVDGGSTPSDGGAADTGASGSDAGVADPDAGPMADTWSSWAMAFFGTYCVECHAGPPSGRDYRTIDDVRRDVDVIRCGVTPSAEPIAGCTAPPDPGMFPVGGGPFPSDEDRRRVIAWLDAGMPE